MFKNLQELSDEYETHERNENDSIKEHDQTAKSVDSYQILDADSSQQEAVLAANNGKDFIISGAPGTGKSQTIANIIAESLANKKKVLFVSEKKTALEVVKKRLESKGLGDYVFELHGTKLNKKEILARIGSSNKIIQKNKFLK